MQLFIYKIYYVTFLFYSKHDEETPWIRAQMVLLGCFGSLAVGSLYIIGLLSFTRNIFHIPNTSGQLTKYIFVFFLLFSIWKGLSYLLYKKMQISKVDGKSPLFEFTPTKKDNILTLTYVLMSVFSIFFIKGIEAIVLAVYDKT
ncbi:hypothetical protein ORI89_16180 [Sphingobacterium sp. UT-1RO-CII-1]|nr:hypothetical protein [Sphingobacterium sp. UT-1RO-CII-1]